MRAARVPLNARHSSDDDSTSGIHGTSELGLDLADLAPSDLDPRTLHPRTLAPPHPRTLSILCGGPPPCSCVRRSRETATLRLSSECASTSSRATSSRPICPSASRPRLRNRHGLSTGDSANGMRRRLPPSSTFPRSWPSARRPSGFCMSTSTDWSRRARSKARGPEVWAPNTMLRSDRHWPRARRIGPRT